MKTDSLKRIYSTNKLNRKNNRSIKKIKNLLKRAYDTIKLLGKIRPTTKNIKRK